MACVRWRALVRARSAQASAAPESTKEGVHGASACARARVRERVERVGARACVRARVRERVGASACA
eukprot:6181160-Pleurochrysis_carterae.AAC.8